MHIWPAGKLLGTFLGPRVASLVWQAAALKFEARTLAAATFAAALAVSVRLYNVQILTVLSYLAQLYALPASLRARERPTLTRLLRFPPGSFRLVDLARFC